MKKILSVFIVALMMMGAPVLADTSAVVSVENKVEIPRSISLTLLYEEPLHFGDEVTIVAALEGYDGLNYTPQWQVSTDNEEWNNIMGANELLYKFTVTKDNYANYYRLVVIIEL